MGGKKLQLVWPKDGPKGRDDRGFFGRLSDIMSGSGPDMFVQRQGKKSITPGQWGNWDSYHDSRVHEKAFHSIPFGNGRGYERYDPYTRKYTNWVQPIDHAHEGVNRWTEEDGFPNPYPRFNEEEMKRMAGRAIQWQPPSPRKMGKEWSHIGPKRFRPEYNWFWQEAHRIGENAREGFPLNSDRNPLLEMHQSRIDDLDDWAFTHWNLNA